jgi:hypothetical protein
MRTFAKYLAAIFGSVIAFVALSGGTAWLLVGNADNATSTAMSVISQDLAGKAAGSVLIERLASEADPAVKAELERESGPLADAAAVGLRASEAAISMAIHGVYSAVNATSSVVVDLTPVFSAVAVELHRVDPRIPADLSAIAATVPGSSDMSIEVDGSKLGILRTTFSIIGAWWALLVAALALLVLAGLCDRRAPVRRWRVTGVSLAIPSAALIVISLAARFAAPPAESGDANTSTLISALLGVVQGTMTRLSGIVLVVALAIIVVTIVVKPSGTDGDEGSTVVAA